VDISIVFPSTIIDEVYTLTISGDGVAGGFVTVSGQPSVFTLNQYINTQLGFGFTSTDGNISVVTPSQKTFTPFQNVSTSQLYTVSATSTTDIFLLSTPPLTGWSGGTNSYYPTSSEYNSTVGSAVFVVDNTPTPKTLTANLTVTVNQAGIPSLARLLDLDSYIASSAGYLMSSSKGDSATACSLPGTPINTVFSSAFVLNGFIYTDSALTTAFQGDDGWYHISYFHTAYKVSIHGKIEALYYCLS
jgi:hypothetical protein